MKESICCELLEWDSNFFGFTIARVTSKSLSDNQAKRVANWAGENAIRCVYYLIDSDDLDSLHAAQDAGFRFVDVRIRLECILALSGTSQKKFKPSGSISVCRSGDQPLLGEIARGLHTKTRFFNDRGFPRSRSRDLYETWIRKGCTGEADAVFVARVGGNPVGYISCHLDPGDLGRIGLLGVHREAQKRGLGKALVETALSWMETQKKERVVLDTQGNNIPVIRLSEKCGFRTHSMKFWWHLWPQKRHC